MSSRKTAQRRVSLLAGSSLIAASLSAVAFTGTALTSSVALAADECGVQAGATPIVCSAGTYAGGVTYDANGDLVITFTPTVVDIGGSGVMLTGDGAESIIFDSLTTSTELQTSSLTGALLDVTTGAGDITISAEEMDADAGSPAGVTHAIRAISTGGGNIGIITTGTIDAQGANADNAIGIEAQSAGGDIAITSTGFNLAGEAYGVLVGTSGAGAVVLTFDTNVDADDANGVAAIDATAGTGGLEINLIGGNIRGGAGDGMAIIGATTGAAVVNIADGSVGEITFNMPNGGGAVDFSGVAGGATFNLAGATNTTGRWLGSGASVFGAGNDTINFQGVGYNYLGGRNALAEASIDFGAGNDTINLASFLNIGGHTQDAGSIDFGAGDDTFNIGGVFTSHGGELANLEALNLSGTILMGHATTGNNNNIQVVWTTTDGVADDVLRANGATFTGSGTARILMDVDIGGGFQEGCETLTGVTDCLDLRGGSTAGVTILTLNNLGPDALLGGYDLTGVTLVDVGGGTSAQGHFVLDPNTTGLTSDPMYGDVIGRPGLFSVMLRYDAETQRHKLVSLPHGEVMEYAMLSGAAQSIWHMTAETVTDRQTELRRGSEGGSVWLRGAGEYSKRDTSSSFAGVGETFTVDNSYKLYAGTVMGGLDLIAGTSGEYDYVLGAQIGYVSSSFELDEGQSAGRMTGATGGVYASLWSDWFFLDGAFNANGLTLDHESPGLGSQTNTYLNSIGGNAEAGIRASLTEGLFAEPLLSLAYVRTSFEEISLSGGEVMPDDATSLRGALGLRLGGTLAGEGASATYFVTGRAWNEFDGESGGIVQNPGADLPFADEFSGAFGEAEVGVNVFNSDNTLSGFLTSGVKWKDGYSAVNLSLGVRMAW